MGRVNFAYLFLLFKFYFECVLYFRSKYLGTDRGGNVFPKRASGYDIKKTKLGKRRPDFLTDSVLWDQSYLSIRLEFSHQ